MRIKARRFKRFKEETERIKDSDMFEIVEEVFDSITLSFIRRLEDRRIIRELKGVVSSGKEARVYWAERWDGSDLAVKIYLVETTDFRKSIRRYIEGDPRFERIPEGNLRKLIYEWARKEYRNLKKMYEAGVRVPKPIDMAGNILVISFIGEKGYRAPLLIEAIEELEEEDVKVVYNDLREQIRMIVCNAELVHADLSEYNIMLWDESPWIIDVSQAVDLSHPRAREFLGRDLENIYKFFGKYIELESFNNLGGEVIKCLEA